MSFYFQRAVLSMLACLLLGTAAEAKSKAKPKPKPAAAAAPVAPPASVAPAPAPAPPPVDPKGVKAKYEVNSGTISYHLVHKLHKVTGTSRKPAGVARFLNNGTVQVQIQAPVASFDSGNSNRDAHMKEVTDAANHPNVVVKASAENFTLPTTFPATFGKDTFGKVAVSFHGQSGEISLNALNVAFSDDTTIRVTGEFPISLEGFKVERPSLFLVKVNDEVKISFDITLKKE